MPFEGRICKLGIWDESVPGIKFNEEGISNYADLQNNMNKQYPNGIDGIRLFESIVARIRKEAHNKRYDCIIGVSGGTDSSYLMHIASLYNLRVLAVFLDNGWSTDISVKNIKKITSKLGYDLETYVIDYSEVQDVLKSYIRARLPWIDAPTDLAIKAILYKIANREKIRYIFNGHDFRTEGKQPREWTYSDSRQLRFLTKKYSNRRLKSFPYLTIFDIFYFLFFKRIRMLRPLYYLDYKKSEAQTILKKEYDWEYYGGHHYENIFTKFAITYWLFEKFGVDKRKITLSAQILSEEIGKEKACAMINEKPYDDNKIESDLNFILKKLDMSKEEYLKHFNYSNKYYYDYPSYHTFIQIMIKYFGFLVVKLFRMKLPMMYENEVRQK